MTPKERVFSRLNGEPVDKVPNLNILMSFAAKYLGVTYKKFATDYKTLVEANIKCCEDFGIDMVSTISDPYRESHGFGANVSFPEDDTPICKDPLVKEYGDIKKLAVNDPLKPERMFDRIRAVELYKEKVGNHYPILGWVEGAFAEANTLRGMNDLLVDLYDEPEFVKELLEICTQQSISFALEQIKAGADFIGVGDAAASLVSPAIYEEFILPAEKRIFSAIQAAGAKVKLHICGNISSLLTLISQSGADMVDLDWMVDLKDAVSKLEGKSSTCGNFDPVKVLLQGTHTDVENAVEECLRVSNKTHFIAAGCEVPVNTPYENMKAVNHVLLDSKI